MKSNVVKGIAMIAAGFGAGVLVSNLPRATAAGAATQSTELAHKHFIVSVDEIKKNFVFADKFHGHYSKSVTLSDWTTRTIMLIPMLHNGMQVVEFKDTGSHTYMGLNGTTTNGKLMVQVRDLDAMRAQLEKEGWSPQPVDR